MIITTTKTSILIICPFPRGLLLTYPISPPPTRELSILPCCILPCSLVFYNPNAPLTFEFINSWGEYFQIEKFCIKHSCCICLLGLYFALLLCILACWCVFCFVVVYFGLLVCILLCWCVFCLAVVYFALLLCIFAC